MKPTKEQVIAWAREARFYEGEIADDIEWFTVLANLAYEAGRADENEACAETAMELLFVYIGSYPINEQFADAIRARGAGMKIVPAKDFNGALWITARAHQLCVKYAVKKEREACADMVLTLTCMGNAKECFEVAATYIRARGEQ